MSSHGEDRDLLYEPIKDRSLSLDRCFLCGIGLDESNKTEEHVFPRWLQAKFDLWNKELTLSNRTAIPYRSLTVPCCIRCNSTHLARIETSVQNAVEGGYDTFSGLDPLVVYQWLLKIYYTILFKELFLVFDRASPSSGATIMRREDFEQFNMCHILLQSTRFEPEFMPDPPWSIFRFRVHQYDDIARNFDFRDSLVALCVSIRMGDIGVVACLEDNNSKELMHTEYFRKFQQHPLHPIQFAEITAMVFYEQTLLNRVPKYLIQLPTEQGMKVLSAPLQGLSSKPIYDEWDQEAYACVLAEIIGAPVGRLYAPPDRVMSWLRDDEGTVKVLGASDVEWP